MFLKLAGVGLLVLVIVSLKHSAAQRAQAGSGISWRRLTVQVAGRSNAEAVTCIPVAESEVAQADGLQFVDGPTHPLGFLFAPAARESFWMKDTPTRLTGIWVHRGRVTGIWHGQPQSLAEHKSPGRVDLVVEYEAHGRVPVPAVGARVSLGGSCPVGSGL